MFTGAVEDYLNGVGVFLVCWMIEYAGCNFVSTEVIEEVDNETAVGDCCSNFF